MRERNEACHAPGVADSPEFLRVQATYRGRLGVEVGVFVAVDHLRRAGILTPEEERTSFDVGDWFLEHLPNPDFYADGNSIGAVTWFKTPVPEPMQERVDLLCGILAGHGVAFDVVRSPDPGEVVYDDDFQIGVIPPVRGERTPMPDGVVHSPTTAGSKRSVAASAIRHVVLDADGVVQVAPGEGGRVAPSPETSALLLALRNNGYGVHLSANRSTERVALLLAGLDDDGLLDIRSSAGVIGAPMPDAAFFAAAARRIGTAPETILFVGDSLARVEAARASGLAGIRWEVRDGHDTLLDLLGKLGVDGRLTVSE